ncbi:coactosin-like protein isoform X1 [Spodoptera litura]|uniref:Coactosin-like protein n=1 Tax=Spodoptera litura TaxID=69820 RepID=A0A9J7DYA7_SPOLT|nr:coactosin-like protein isoform X1 [Spodoptera litura]
MDGEEIRHVEVSYKLLQDHINKLTENQTNIINKFEVLNRNVDELRKTLAQFSDKINTLEEVSMDRKKLKIEIKILKNRIDELYAIVKEGKEDDSNPSADPQEVESCHSGFSCSSKVTMTTGLDRDTIRAAYEDVRSDTTPTEWAVFKFDGARIVCSARGSDFTEFRTQFSDDDRAFGYLRLQMGDEMSKRKKFLFVTWVGPNVSVINRAKMSTDKAIIKDIISNFAVELQLENQSEIDIDQFKDALNRAGGANYGTGVRDL